MLIVNPSVALVYCAICTLSSVDELVIDLMLYSVKFLFTSCSSHNSSILSLNIIKVEVLQNV